MQCDETANNAGKKELQLRIRYRSESTNIIISHQLESFSMGQVTSDILREYVKSFINANWSLKNSVHSK